MTHQPDVLDYIDKSPLFSREDVTREQGTQNLPTKTLHSFPSFWTHAAAAAAGGVVVLLLHRIAAKNLTSSGTTCFTKL